jgi:hypothetical protein
MLLMLKLIAFGTPLLKEYSTPTMSPLLNISIQCLPIYCPAHLLTSTIRESLLPGKLLLLV